MPLLQLHRFRPLNPSELGRLPGGCNGVRGNGDVVAHAQVSMPITKLIEFVYRLGAALPDAKLSVDWGEGELEALEASSRRYVFDRGDGSIRQTEGAAVEAVTSRGEDVAPPADSEEGGDARPFPFLRGAPVSSDAEPAAPSADPPPPDGKPFMAARPASAGDPPPPDAERPFPFPSPAASPPERKLAVVPPPPSPPALGGPPPPPPVRAIPVTGPTLAEAPPPDSISDGWKAAAEGRVDDARLAFAYGFSSEDRDELRRLLASTDPVKVVRGCVAARAGDQRTSATSIRRLVGHADRRVRLAAVEALGELGGPSMVPSLSPALRDNDPEIKAAAEAAAAAIEARAGR